MVSKASLILDIIQFAADLVGIADPTGTVDAANGVVYLLRGKWLDAATSAIGIIPWVGDAAKLRKIPGFVQSCLEAMWIAKKDAKFMSELQPALKNLKELALDKIPLDRLPKHFAEQIRHLQKEIDAFLKAGLKRMVLVPRKRFFDDATARELLKASEGVRSSKTAAVGHAGSEHVMASNMKIQEHAARDGAKIAMATGFLKFEDQVRATREALNDPISQAALAHLDAVRGALRVTIEVPVSPLTVRIANPHKTWTQSVDKVRLVIDRTSEGIHLHTLFPILEYSKGVARSTF